MLQYAIVEIAGRQYKVEPNKQLVVDSLGDLKQFECDKILLKKEGDKLTFGDPYLKEKLTFTVLSTDRGPKVRVATYHAKANTRKVKGSRRVTSTIKLEEKSDKKAAETPREKK